jgi:DNA uptake protein ComE-like DNA-binding protein
MDTATESILATSGLSPVGPGPDEKPRTPLLDVNSASLQELVKSGVFSDDQLMAVVKKRESRPFRSIDELRVALDLKPHEFAQVRKKVEVTQTGPQPTPSPSSRIVDL